MDSKTLPNLAFETPTESVWNPSRKPQLKTDLYGVPPFDYPHELFQTIYDENSSNEYVRVGGQKAPRPGLNFRCQRCKRKCNINQYRSCPCLNYAVPVKCPNGETQLIDSR